MPRVTEEHYIKEILKICQIERIDLIVPLIDTELLIFAENRHLFTELDVKVLVSGKN